MLGLRVPSEAAGERVIICASVREFKEFLQVEAQTRLSAENMTWDALKDAAMRGLVDADLMIIKQKCIFKGAVLPAQSLCFIPPDYLVWESTTTEPVHGLRYSFLYKLSEQCIEGCKMMVALHAGSDSTCALMKALLAAQVPDAAGCRLVD